MDLRSERGLTLTELTVVAVLASIVMLGMVGFYISSQGTWMDASAQAITQREATTLLDNIAERTHAAAQVNVVSGGTQIELCDTSATVQYVFWLRGDSLIHAGPSTTQDQGPVVRSICERFQCTRSDSLLGVQLVLRSAQGSRVGVSTQIAILNRGTP